MFEKINHNIHNPENSLLVLGVAPKGPPRQIVQLSKAYNYDTVFGESTLSKAFQLSIEEDFNNIFFYRLNGTEAHVTIKELNTEKDLFALRMYSGEETNIDDVIKMFPTHMTFEVEEEVFTYLFSEFPTIDQLCERINRDSLLGYLPFYAEAIDRETPTQNLFAEESSFYFNEGSGEEEFLLNRNGVDDLSVITPKLREYIDEALFSTETISIQYFEPNGEIAPYDFGTIVLTDFYADDDASIIEKFSQYAKSKKEEKEFVPSIVLGLSPITEMFDDVSEENYVDIESYRDKAILYEETVEKKPSHRHIEIVLGNDADGTPLALYYALSKASVPVHINMTNKKISQINHISYEFIKEDVDLFTSKGYICIVPSIRKNFVAYKSQTFIRDTTSLFSKPHNVRIENHFHVLFSDMFSDKIGKPIDQFDLNDIKKQVEEAMNGLVEKKMIKSYYLSDVELKTKTEISVSLDVQTFSDIDYIKAQTEILVPEGMVVL